MTKQTRSPTHDAVKLRAQAERARQAEELTSHPLMIEAFDIMEKEIEEGWRNSSSEDRQARDNAYLLIRLLTRLRGHFKAIIVNGNNAKTLLTLEEIKGGSS